MLNIRKYREMSGLTQAQVAEKAGVGANAVSQWETGVRSPCVKHIQTIASLFGCSVDDLLRPDYENKCSKPT
jgi:transcriptional regulator with XRE-family HTH domain